MQRRAKWRQLRDRFIEAGIDTAELDARVLLCAALNIEPSHLIAAPGAPIGTEEDKQINAFADRRVAREPVSHILGYSEFYGLRFDVNAHVLDPRPDTETLVEAVLARADIDEAHLVADLGTGSGCILCALLSEMPQARGVGIDISSEALQIAARNALQLGLADRVQWKAAGWDALQAHTPSIVVSNPPYIPTRDIDGLMPEVAQYDPRHALDGGPDGLDAYRAITDELDAARSLPSLLALEVGDGQSESVAEMVDALKPARLEIVPDLAGIARVVVARFGI